MLAKPSVTLVALLSLLAGSRLSGAVPSPQADATDEEAFALTDIQDFHKLLAAPDSDQLAKLVDKTFDRYDGSTGGVMPIAAFSEDINRFYSDYTGKTTVRACDDPSKRAVVTLPKGCMAGTLKSKPALTGIQQVFRPARYDVWLNSPRVNETIFEHVNDATKTAVVAHFYRLKAQVRGYQPKNVPSTPLAEGVNMPDCVYLELLCMDEKSFVPTPNQLSEQLDKAFSMKGSFVPPTIYTPAWVANLVFQKRYQLDKTPEDVCLINTEGVAESRGGSAVAKFSSTAECLEETGPNQSQCKHVYVTCM